MVSLEEKSKGVVNLINEQMLTINTLRITSINVLQLMSGCGSQGRDRNLPFKKQTLQMQLLEIILHFLLGEHQ